MFRLSRNVGKGSAAVGAATGSGSGSGSLATAHWLQQRGGAAVEAAAWLRQRGQRGGSGSFAGARAVVVAVAAWLRCWQRQLSGRATAAAWWYLRCYILLLWYLFRVLTYESHVTSL